MMQYGCILAPANGAKFDIPEYVWDGINYIDDLLWANEIYITDRDIYLAWLISGNGFWEDPFSYGDKNIIGEIMRWVKPLPGPVIDETDFDDYEPKSHFHLEGEDYYED